jgi:hypothetical protein
VHAISVIRREHTYSVPVKGYLDFCHWLTAVSDSSSLFAFVPLFVCGSDTARSSCRAMPSQQQQPPVAARGADLGAAARGGGGRGAGPAVPPRGRAHAHHPPRHQGQQHPPRRAVGAQDRRLRHGPSLPGGRRRPLPRPHPRRRHQRLHGARVPHARRPLHQGRRLQLRRRRPRDRLRPQELRLHPAPRLRG